MTSLRTLNLVSPQHVEEYYCEKDSLNVVMSDEFNRCEELIEELRNINYDVSLQNTNSKNVITFHRLRHLPSDDPDTIRYGYNEKVILVFDLLQDNFVVNIPR